MKDPLDNFPRGTRNRMLQMASGGYGWEDIFVSWGIRNELERQIVRRMVLNRTWRGAREVQEYAR